ncbi:KICSTOR complex protein ITFG2 [Varanus komodoensis]|nr:KICSTOR complex protein ITFG2 [Varanus komodoensis]
MDGGEHDTHVDATVPDVHNGDGKSELVVGYTDRVVRAFRWEDSSESSEYISGQLVLLKKWLLEGQNTLEYMRTTEELYNFNYRNEEIEIVGDCAYLGSVISSKGDCSQEIKRKLRLGRAAMKELEKIIKYKNIFLETEAKIIHTIIL